MDSDFRGGQNQKSTKPIIIKPDNLSDSEASETNSSEVDEIIYDEADGKADDEVVINEAEEPEFDESNNQDEAGEAGDSNSEGDDPESDTDKPRNGFWSRRWRFSKKTTIIMLVIALVLLAGGIAAAVLMWQHNPGQTITTKKPKFTPKETRVPGNLSGVLVDPAVNKRPVIGVMIENSRDARPQSGMDQAGVVFEAIAEGGITRFLTLYQENQPDYIGPVRSVRPYYVQWCMSFDCALGHVGGSPEALQNIRSWGAKDLDQFANAGQYWRSNQRYAPHNVYTGVPKLQELATAKGYGEAKFTPLVRKKEAKSTAPNATSIDLNISSALFNSHFDYDSATNAYKRSQGGAPHMVVDANGKEFQLHPKVVVALVMSYGVAADKHSAYGTIGSGNAVIFQDGTVTTATWHKSAEGSAISLTDAAGKAVGLNAGQTWFTVLGADGQVVYR